MPGGLAHGLQVQREWDMQGKALVERRLHLAGEYPVHVGLAVGSEAGVERLVHELAFHDADIPGQQ